MDAGGSCREGRPVLGPISPIILSRPPLTAFVTTDKRGPVADQSAPAPQTPETA
jgi:hypothetical protein